MKRYLKASNEQKTFQNKRNPNKFIETKKYSDGHTYSRQYMKWDTENGEVKNYLGSKSNRGRYARTGKNTLDSVLDDYTEVESSETTNDLMYEFAVGEKFRGTGLYGPSHIEMTVKSRTDDSVTFDEAHVAEDSGELVHNEATYPIEIVDVYDKVDWNAIGKQEAIVLWEYADHKGYIYAEDAR